MSPNARNRARRSTPGTDRCAEHRSTRFRVDTRGRHVPPPSHVNSRPHTLRGGGRLGCAQPVTSPATRSRYTSTPRRSEKLHKARLHLAPVPLAIEGGQAGVGQVPEHAQGLPPAVCRTGETRSASTTNGPLCNTAVARPRPRPRTCAASAASWTCRFSAARIQLRAAEAHGSGRRTRASSTVAVCWTWSRGTGCRTHPGAPVRYAPGPQHGITAPTPSVSGGS